jgi:hypothetical protein
VQPFSDVSPYYARPSAKIGIKTGDGNIFSMQVYFLQLFRSVYSSDYWAPHEYLALPGRGELRGGMVNKGIELSEHR